jgi:hypothetical protein
MIMVLSSLPEALSASSTLPSKSSTDRSACGSAR